MKSSDLKALMKRVVELVMPDLRAYYRVVRKARVVKTYASDGRYWADVQPLRNDESVDPSEPVVPRVEIPVMWAGPDRGVVCPPQVGAYCDLEYYDGDPNYPRISNFRWHGNMAPACEVGAFIIQKADGVYIKIDAGNNIIDITPAGRQSEIGGDGTESVDGSKTVEIGGDLTRTVGGDVSESATGTWTIQSAAAVNLTAPQINLVGNLSATGAGGATGSSYAKADMERDGNYQLNGNLTVNGNINATGTIIDSGGNTNHHTHV